MRPPHTPVMLAEITKFLSPEPGKHYLDCTLGAGGHTLALLEKGAKVTGIDRDQEALKLAKTRVEEAGYQDNFETVHSSFAKALSANNLAQFDGILFDLGVSSMQLDTKERGFSFRYDAPLDMRMDKDNQQVSAKDLVNGLGRKELYELFTELGEERFARRITEAILSARKLAPINSTKELAELIKRNTPRSKAKKIHPATKVFQALRMAVNTEREELTEALSQSLNHLNNSGTVVVISFHSGEDKLVKKQLKEWEQSSLATLPPSQPFTPTEEEINTNPRARSAKLRVARKVSK